MSAGLSVHQERLDLPLGLAERSKLRDHVRVLVGCTSIARAREIAKDAKLLGRDATKATPAELKRLIPDGDRLGAILAEALVDRARQRAALSTIARLGQEAFRSPRAEDRLGVLFSKARTALVENDWQRLESRLAQLAEVRWETDVELVACAQLVLAATSQRASRVHAALGPAPRLRPSTYPPPSTVSAAAPPQTILPTDTKALPYLGVSTGETPALAPQISPTERLSIPTVAPSAVPIESAAVVVRHAAASNAVDDANSAIPWGNAVDSWRAWFLDRPGEPDLAHDDGDVSEVVAALRAVVDAVPADLPREQPDLASLERIEASHALVAIALTNAIARLTRSAHVLRGRITHGLIDLRQLVGGSPRPSEPTVAMALAAIADLVVERDELMRQVREQVDALTEAQKNLPHWEGWLRTCSSPGSISLQRSLDELHGVVHETREALAEQKRVREEQEEIEIALRERPAAQLSIAPDERPDGLHFSSARPLPPTFPTSPFYSAHIKQQSVPKTDAGAAPYFLPCSLSQDENPGTLTTGSTAPEVHLTVAAANLLRYWTARCADDYFPPSRLLGLIGDARTILEATSVSNSSEAMTRAVVGLAIESCAGDRTRASARRRRRAFLGAIEPTICIDALVKCSASVAQRPAMARACAELLRHGFGDVLLSLVPLCADRDAVSARALVGAIAAALAGLTRTQSPPLIRQALDVLGLPKIQIDAVDDYLEDAQRKRKGREAEVPNVLGPPIVRDFVRDLGVRFRERGQGEPQVNVSLPLSVRTVRFHAPAGASSIEFPLLVSATGSSGAVGIELVLQRPTRSDSPIRQDFLDEQHVAWLSDNNLRETASVLVPCRVDVDSDRIGDFNEIDLTVRLSWLGGRGTTTHTITVPLTHEREPIRFKEVFGVSGEPVDLLAARTLALSSSSVRECFTQIRDSLARSQSVRAVVYGRRRRGKSSISLSLSHDPEVMQRWHVVRDQLNSTPLTSLAAALERLSGCVAEGLRAAGVPATPPQFTTESVDRLTGAYQQWLRTTCQQAKEPVRVLMLLDEFQRWMSRLSSQEAQALLTVLREFNERSLGQVEVSFVLLGLRNLIDLAGLSTDLLLAVDRKEIKQLSQKETDAYLDEFLEPQLDGRAKRRLWQLSGGNPYILNRLGAALQRYLTERERAWATALDIEALVEDPEARDGRLDDYLAYMIREGEEDNAPTLRELTVLRAVAALLHARRDYDGDVRVEEVESWLDRNQTRRDEGLPAEQLGQLVKVGVLDMRAGGRYALAGEWICRQLALMGAALQPVVRKEITPLILNRFLTKHVIASGGQSDVVLAENKIEGGNDVVLKIYRRGSGDLQSMVEREQRLLGRIYHPNVVKCLGAQVDEQQGGVVILQRVDGESLKTLLDERPEEARPILPGGDISAQVKLFVDVADGLAECHAQGIAHKDLTPANIMVAQRLGDWTPTIIDFGISGIDGELDSALGKTTQLFSPGYTAPEKFKIGRRSRASDIWALGRVMLHSFTGKKPTDPDFDHVSLLNSCGLRERLIALLERMLTQNPEERPTAAEVRDELRVALRPTTWIDLREEAETAVCEDRWDDAAEFIQQAVNTTPLVDRTSETYVEVLRLAVCDILPTARVSIPWFREVQNRVVELCAQRPGALKVWKELFDETESAWRDRQQREDLLRVVLARLDDAPCVDGLAPAVLELAKSDRNLPEGAASACFDLLAAYALANKIERAHVAAFCMRQVELGFARTSGSGARAWLRRAEIIGRLPQKTVEETKLRLGGGDTPSITSEPIPCIKFLGADVGNDEHGHLDVSRIDGFALRVHRRCDFVCGIKRVGRERAHRVPRPTLLPLETAKGLRKSEANPFSMMQAMLDEGFTKGDGSLRVQILLDPNTTAAQREEAFRRLAEEDDIFDVRR